MKDNIVCFRRLRRTKALRQIIRQPQFTLDNLIMPLFVEESITAQVTMESMPGLYCYVETELADYLRRLWRKDIKGILLFGILHNPDKGGPDTWNINGE